MPGLYDYECETCGLHFEVLLPFSECDSTQNCPVCHAVSKKIMTCGHGGIIRTGDSVPWVRDAALTLGDGERPNPNIHTVQDLRDFYQANPNIRPKESHPAFPSEYGDAMSSRPDPAEVKRQRSKKGHEKLRKLRSITV